MGVVEKRDPFAIESLQIFEGKVGAEVSVEIEQVGPERFLSFIVGREAPIYLSALSSTQSLLSDENPYRGKLRLKVKHAKKFPGSLEANCLQTLLTRSTRTITEGHVGDEFAVPYVPFQNREDHVLAQPAAHIVLGRRGVGKSTLIVRAVDLLSRVGAISIVLDMQAYATMTGDAIIVEVVNDLLIRVREAIAGKYSEGVDKVLDEIDGLLLSVSKGHPDVQRISPQIKRLLRDLNARASSRSYVFLDDFHVIDSKVQPKLLHFLNGAMKGSSSWLKVAGVRSLINNYSASDRIGLQVPGDAQEISLDLTLENPEAAERHLRAILESFLHAVGYSLTERVLPDAAFKRLVWANAGVPRDFLQMFARALEHSQRNRHSSVTVSDVNIAIGEFGQKKFQEMRDDARGDLARIDTMIQALDRYCLDIEKINGFLLKSEDSEERDLVRKLSDLRLVHLIHQSITPDSAGEKYEAFIVDYALFTGFRRRPNVKEMVPSEAQFKASELRRLPKIERGFVDRFLSENFQAKQPKANPEKKRSASKGKSGKKAGLSNVSKKKAVNRKKN